MNYYLSLINANPNKDKFNFMVFLGDKPQPFSIDGKGSEQYSYIQDIPAYSLINIPISFKPVIGKKGDHQNIWFVFSYLLNKKPNSQNHIPFFLNYMKKTIVLRKGSNEYVSLSKPLCNLDIFPLKKTASLNHSLQVIISKDKKVKNIYQNTRIKFNRSKELNLWINAISNEFKKYTTYLFVDNKPVLIDGYNCIKWKIKRNEMLNQRITINVPEKAGEHQMYTITIPNSSKSEILYESEKFILDITK